VLLVLLPLLGKATNKQSFLWVRGWVGIILEDRRRDSSSCCTSIYCPSLKVLGFLDKEQKKWERKDWVKKPSIWCLELCWVLLGFEKEEEEDSLVGGWVGVQKA
jgi:hypothetical protein